MIDPRHDADGSRALKPIEQRGQHSLREQTLPLNHHVLESGEVGGELKSSNPSQPGAHPMPKRQRGTGDFLRHPCDYAA